MKNISCLITHSIGELDILLPILNKLSVNHKIKIIFTVKKIYEEYNKNNLYKFFTKKNQFKFCLFNHRINLITHQILEQLF